MHWNVTDKEKDVSLNLILFKQILVILKDILIKTTEVTLKYEILTK